MLPQIHVINKGALRGFVIINPRWAGFAAEDYITAVDYITPILKQEHSAETNVTPEIGSIDFRGYEIVRGQFFEASRSCSVTLTIEHFRFTTDCLKKLNETRLVELLFDPIRKLLAVRPTTKTNKNAIEWLYFDGQKSRPRQNMGRAFLPVIYELMGWNQDWTHHIKGECMDNGEDSFLIFYLKDAEGIINRQPLDEIDTLRFTQQPELAQPIKAMPQEWLSSFGASYYNPSIIPPANNTSENWDAQAPGTPIPRNDPFDATTEADLKHGIDSLIATITERSTAYDGTN